MRAPIQHTHIQSCSINNNYTELYHTTTNTTLPPTTTTTTTTTGYATTTGSCDDVCFTAAGVSIVQNVPDRKQTFFGEHADDIISMVTYDPTTSLNSNGSSNSSTMIATGEIGKKPSIHVYSWNETKRSFQAITCLNGYFTGGVVQLSFSCDGKFIFGSDTNYKVALYCIDINDR